VINVTVGISLAIKTWVFFSLSILPCFTLKYIYIKLKMASAVEAGKKTAAYRVVDEYLTPDLKVVGIGSGSTVVYVVERILQRPELKHIVYIPTSFQSKLLIVEGGLTLGSIEQ
jgi:hypothetical protein